MIEGKSMVTTGEMEGESSAANNSNDEALAPMNESDVKPSAQSLSDFLLQLEDYTPSIPDGVISYYLQSSGLDTSDPRIIRLISLAAQKFLSDVANDALQHCKTRGVSQNAKTKGKDRRYMVTLEDLTPALAEYGIAVRKPHYYV